MKTLLAFICAYLATTVIAVVGFTYLVVPTLRPGEGRSPAPWRILLTLPVGVVAGVTGATAALALGAEGTITLPLLGTVIFLSTARPLRPELSAKYPKRWMLALAVSICLGIAIVGWRLAIGV